MDHSDATGASAGLSLVRFRDRNEALGLALRLVGLTGPFQRMPMGLTLATLIALVDSDRYLFARRADNVVGFVGWGLASVAVAEEWLAGRAPAAEAVRDGPCVLVFALQAVDSAVLRFMTTRLSDDIFRDKPRAYFIRDYGPGPDGRPRVRGVRLRRPRVRRTPGVSPGP